jgi:hypothetical protein
MFRRILVLASRCICAGTTRRLLVITITLVVVTLSAAGQSLEDLNVQIHGYATQGFLYTTNNNILTTRSNDGSPNWTEAVINISAQPTSKLRISVQGRYELLGNYSNNITLDYASADYKVSDGFGIRFGKVKTPSNLFNETQDIDPSYLWALLPQSVYPISSRNGILSEYGGIAYGTLSLEDAPKLGKLEYRGWGGENSLASNDGYFLSFAEGGTALPNGLSGVSGGAALHYRAAVVPGLMFGASFIQKGVLNGEIVAGSAVGSFIAQPISEPAFFAKYERNKLMVAVERNRQAGSYVIYFGGPPAKPARFDDRGIYAMASYKLTGKFTSGVYDSQYFGATSPLGPARYQKDWDISGRYDFNQYIYAKAEEHFLDGTALSYDANLNPGGLKPTTKMTVLKIGVSF